MTASWEALEKELQKSAPTQLVHNFWHDQEDQIIAECEAKGACACGVLVKKYFGRVLIQFARCSAPRQAFRWCRGKGQRCTLGAPRGQSGKGQK
jgi:hypothetical protein